MGFSWRFGWVVGFGLVLASQGGCANPLPVVPGEETSSGDGEISSSEVVSTGVLETSTGALDTSTGESGIEPGCGNGIVEAGETCDERGQTVACDEDCTPVTCGDGLVNEAAGEECDGDELPGGSCEGLGFDVGVLACEARCSYDVSDCYVLPEMPVLELTFSQIKRFDFSWAAVAEAEYYQLLESPTLGQPYAQLGGDIVGEPVSFEMPLHFRWQASYVLRACNGGGCTDSAAVSVMGPLAEAVGYVKASNTGPGDEFGTNVALSADGNTLAVAAVYEDSNATGIGGNQANDSASESGAVYVFERNGVGTWSQQAYVKASNTDAQDFFGYSVTLSGDGTTLAVGARDEDGGATGVGGDEANATTNTGAVYVFERDGVGAWSQQAYIKASNTGANDRFGWSVALSEGGNVLAVGATGEGSNAMGIGGNQADNSASQSGAVYVFERDGVGAWSQQAYVKASNTDAQDYFGSSVTLSGDGNTLVVGAPFEDSNATDVGGNQADDSADASGAVYVFARDVMGSWSQQAYVKASNTGAGDYFGSSVTLSGDGNTLAVGAYYEDSNATGIDGDQAGDSADDSGSVYVFERDGMGAWLQQAYVKASNTDEGSWFGYSVTLSGDGNTLAVGASSEDSGATGIGGNQADDSATSSGAVYMFTRDGMGAWSQLSYVKASNTDAIDRFGTSVALSVDGTTLTVGALYEASNAMGIGGNQADDSALYTGAVYLY